MFIKVDECMLAIVFLFLNMLGIICPTKSRSHYIIMYTFRNSQQRAEKRTGSHHENHSTPPWIMYAVRETRRLLPCYSRMEFSLNSVFLSLVLNSADYSALIRRLQFTHV